VVHVYSSKNVNYITLGNLKGRSVFIGGIKPTVLKFVTEIYRE
jgi:hypothetical protein